MPKRVRTVVTREVETPGLSAQINPLIRRYLDVEGWDPGLSDFQYTIMVQKLDDDGSKKTVGRTFDDLFALPGELARRFGEARFKLYINYERGEGEKGFCRIENFETMPEEEPEEPGPEEIQQQTAAALNVQLALQREQQAHEIRMKELDNQRAMMVAALQAKTGGGGAKFSDLLAALKAGMQLAAGRLPDDDEPGDGEPGDDEPQDPLTQALTTAGVKMITDKLLGGDPPPAAVIPQNGTGGKTDG